MTKSKTYANLNDLYSTGQAAKALGITEPQLNNHIRRGYLAPIAIGPGGRRLWTANDIDDARRVLAARKRGGAKQ